MLPPPDISANYVDEQRRPSKDFYNWLKSLDASVRNSSGSSGGLVFNVKDYGAVGNYNIADDAVAIQAAIDAAAVNGGVVFFPPGNFGVSAKLSISASNVRVMGSGKGITTITPTVAPIDPVFFFFGGSNDGGISDLTIDNNISNAQPSIFAQGYTSGFFVRNVAIVNNAAKYGITVQLCDYFDISDNYINRTTAINTENHGILVTAAGQNSYGIIARNTCINTNIEADGQYFLIEDNNVSDWKYGGGVTMGPSAFSHENIIRGNICHGGGPGVDADVTYPTGVEVFALRCIISNNICFNNAGNGIVVGGKNCSVTGNVCYDNGQAAHGGDVSGILLQDGGASNRANDCIVTSNNCFNLVGVTQEYGIQVNSACSGYIIWPNQLVGNNTAAHNAIQTVATLPSASGSGVGARAYVTNATVTTFASVVVGGGGNAVPVTSDGTNWRIG